MAQFLRQVKQHYTKIITLSLMLEKKMRKEKRRDEMKLFAQSKQPTAMATHRLGRAIPTFKGKIE